MLSRDAVLAAIDVEDLYAWFSVPLTPDGSGQFKAHCPFHADSTPSLHVNAEGVYYCFGCGAKGSPVDFVVFMERGDHSDDGVRAEPPPARGEITRAFRWLVERYHPEREPRAPTPIRTAPKRPAQPPVDPAEIAGWVSDLAKHPDVLRFLSEARGLSAETIQTHVLGYDERSGRITIPVYNAAGECVNVRKYLPPPRAEGVPKVVSYAKGYGENRVYPLPAVEEPILLCAGEMDTLLARQLGYNACTFTSGEGTIPAPVDVVGWKRAFVFYDNDEAGRKGTTRITAFLQDLGCEVRSVTFPPDTDGLDLTDLVVQCHFTKEQLDGLLFDSRPRSAAPGNPGPAALEPVRVDPGNTTHLADAGHSDYANRQERLVIEAFVVGKDTQPYLAPHTVVYECPSGADGRKPCADCPVMGGRLTHTLTAKDEHLMRTIGCSDTQQIGVLKDLVGISPGCRHAKVVVESRQNLELVRISPPLDAVGRKDRYDPGSFAKEHVQRHAFVRGIGITPNRSYAFTGYTGAAKDQQVSHVFDEYAPLETDAEAFHMTTELNRALRVFRPAKGQSVWDKWTDIAQDLETNVHEIFDRHDMQMAFDLVAFSTCKGFFFRGRYVNRSWVQGLCIGDSGQGKSHIAEELRWFYRAGLMFSCENARTTGLIGSCVQYGTNNWRIQWSAYPNANMGLLILDELHELKDGQFSELSTARSSGVASIRKVAGGETPARVRLLCLSNPSGVGDRRRLASFANGVEAVLELIPEIEDIRRFDFALTVATGEVASSVYNAANRAAVPHRYTSDLNHDLLLWAWSRSAEQIVFTSDAELACLEAATDMAERYSANVPLVEGADQRIKIARLAIAAAARTFSSDSSGEQIVVTPAHVEFAHRYLEAIYTKPSMAYDEFSLQHREATDLTPQLTQEIANALYHLQPRQRGEKGGWQRLLDVLRSFRRPFLLRQLAEMLSLDEEDTRQLMSAFVAYNLVRHSSHGYVKTPRFIAWLRAADTIEVVEQPEADHKVVRIGA